MISIMIIISSYHHINLTERHPMDAILIIESPHLCAIEWPAVQQRQHQHSNNLQFFALLLLRKNPCCAIVLFLNILNSLGSPSFLGFGLTGEFLILPSVCCSRWKIFRRSCHQCWSLWNVSWDQFPGKDDLETLSPGRQIVTSLGGVNVLCLALRLQRSALLFYPPICNSEQNTWQCWHFVLRVKTSPRHLRCQ